MFELCHTHVFLCTAFVHFPPAQMLPLQTFVSNPHRAGADLILTYYATQAANWYRKYTVRNGVDIYSAGQLDVRLVVMTPCFYQCTCISSLLYALSFRALHQLHHKARALLSKAG